jgi:23S rRNA (adenine2503-C2)-methyltransferase
MSMNLKALDAEEVREFLASRGLPPYRARQLLHWMYERRVSDLDDITEFSKNLRASLAREAHIGGLELMERQVSSDGTEKFLFGLEDGFCVESVLIPQEERLALCVSSQMGCAMGCRFCLTARDGLRRNLLAHEIVEQVLAVARCISPRRIGNIVMMGMGEPLANLDEVVEALWRMTELVRISPRRITVSTCGLADRLEEFARRAPPVGLAVSLNATTDEVRSRIMPVNRRFPIARLLDACRKYPLPPRRRMTFEYVLIAGVNDGEADARRLVRLLRGIRCKLNLIPLNAFEGSPDEPPSEEQISHFQRILTGSGLTAPVRKSRGADILAACGQLAAKGRSEQAPDERGKSPVP